MRIACLIAAIALLLLPAQAMAASQISPRDGLWLSLPPDMVKCIIIRLPQDAGLSGTRNYIFSMRVTPSPQETWADFSEQLVREVHKNNTVDLPVCFDKHADKPMGNCSVPYTISVSEEYTGALKEWHGGICVSEYADVDIVSPGEMPTSGEEVKEILNDNTDIFSAWLDEKEQYARPGGSAVFNLSVESYAELDITVMTQSELEVSPGQASLQTGQGSPHQYQAFGLTAPSQEGTYTLTLSVSPETCQGKSYCTKFLEGTLIVSEDDPPEKTGFEVVLRPENIDIKEPEGVIMTLSIINNEGEARAFTSSINIEPGDGSSGFTGETVDVGAYDSHSRVFVVTPGSASTLYEITARAESQGLVSSATSFITIDEMLTDALRQAEGLGSDAQEDVNSWIDSHANSEYGSDLQEYGSLRDTLAEASARQGQVPANGSAPANDSQGQTDGHENPPDMTWLVIVIVIAVGVVAAFVLLMKRGSGGDEGSGETEYY